MAVCCLRRGNFQWLCRRSLVSRRHIRTFSAFPNRSRGLMIQGAVVVGLGCGAAVAWKFLKPTAVERRVSCESNPSVSQLDRKPDKTERLPIQEVPALNSCVSRARSLVQAFREQTSSPGLVVAVSVDGRLVWSEGFGYADVENGVPCSPDTVMRIASISKPLTATAVARLWEEGKLDLDVPVQQYVPSFPEKTFQGKKVSITTRHLLSHLGGIRNYEETKENQQESAKQEEETRSKLVESNISTTETSENSQKKQGKTKRQKENMGDYEFHWEFYIKDHYDSVTDSLALFQDDPLLSEPGTTYHYTTHGWTLISAVVEGAAKQDFLKYMKQLFRDLGMDNTCADLNDAIIYNRARFYQRGKKGVLLNAPYVDISYKWAGGGLMSTVGDLIQFGNAMLYAKQIRAWTERQLNRSEGGQNKCLAGILQPDTMEELWKIVTSTEGKEAKDIGYCMGWARQREAQEFGACRHQKETIQHEGGAVGASSILLIQPSDPSHWTSDDSSLPPRGIVVSIIMNLQGVNISKTARKVAKCFEELQNIKKTNV